MKDIDPLEDAEEVVQAVDKTVNKSARKVFRKYPTLFTTLSLFGFAAVLYGFEGLMERHSYFSDHPGVVLVVGFVILLFTGTLYNWLQNKEIKM